MTPTSSDILSAGDPAVTAPLHCGGTMILREASYRGSSYGSVAESPEVLDGDLVWACSCGFQLSYEEPPDLALPLSPALRRVAAAAADLESVQWHLDQLTSELEAAVLRAAGAGAAIVDIAHAADLEPADVRQLASGGRLLDVG